MPFGRRCESHGCHPQIYPTIRQAGRSIRFRATFFRRLGVTFFADLHFEPSSISVHLSRWMFRAFAKKSLYRIVGRTRKMSGISVHTTTALKRWSCADKQLPAVERIKSIHIYDFDNTCA